MLKDWGIQVSMNGVGSWYDNAPMESFFGTLKSEWVYQDIYHTRNEAKADLFYYIEVFYKETCGHKSRMPAIVSSSQKRRPPKPLVQQVAADDPLVDLRQSRGWIDQIDEQTLWKTLIQIRWPNGPECPCCGENDPRYLQEIDADYRNGLGRWKCQVCAEAGDPGQGGTFTPLTGPIFNGMRIDVRTLWLIVSSFANGDASVTTAKEASIHCHTTDRLFRAAIYQARSEAPLTLTLDDIV